MSVPYLAAVAVAKKQLTAGNVGEFRYSKHPHSIRVFLAERRRFIKTQLIATMLSVNAVEQTHCLRYVFSSPTMSSKLNERYPFGGNSL